MPKGKSAVSPGQKAKLKPTSLKLAIAAFCYHSCFSEARRNSHETKNLIRECKNTACELWPHRGWQATTGGNIKKDDSEVKPPEKPPLFNARLLR